jgi:hypothetical protein
MSPGRSKYTKEAALNNGGGNQQQSNGHRSSTATTGMTMTLSTEQETFMESDMVLVVDIDDAVIGSASKRTSHVFNQQQPHGILHRAFSVFLFDVSTNKLLLQKRAADKITFPNVRFVLFLFFCLSFFLIAPVFRQLIESKVIHQLGQRKFNPRNYLLVLFFLLTSVTHLCLNCSCPISFLCLGII